MDFRRDTPLNLAPLGTASAQSEVAISPITEEEDEDLLWLPMVRQSIERSRRGTSKRDDEDEEDEEGLGKSKAVEVEAGSSELAEPKSELE